MTADPVTGYQGPKRVLDWLVSLVVLIILSPLLIVLALIIRGTSPGPALYRPKRVGRYGRDFTMLKYRTMVPDADRRGASSTSADDPRITRIGKFLRRYKLDELPQLINVFRGDMSFVGPRPQIRWAVDLYTPEEQRILQVRPGITDYASIKYRNEAEILRGSTDPDGDYLIKIAPGKNRLALTYVDTMSLAVDAKIVTATALAVVGFSPDWCLPDEEDLRGN